MCEHCPLTIQLNLPQNHGASYPTLCRIALDYLTCQASSVPCERLFSAGGEVATKRRARLGAARFEELQMMKSAWRNNISDFASWNSSQIEEIDDEVRQYSDMLAGDEDLDKWDNLADEIHIGE
jgi:hypothetical protein